MGTILASAVIAKAQVILSDSDGDQWLEADLLTWLNEAQIEAVILKPDIHIETKVITLVAGTAQSTPTGVLIPVDIVRNMGEDGATPGLPVVKLRKEILDEMLPTWHTATADSTVKFVIANKKSPKIFHVYPPQPTADFGSLETICSTKPTAIATSGDTITIDDEYEGPLVDYLLYKAYSMDADYAGETGRAMAHYAKFAGTLGAKEQGEDKA